MRISDWSSDVCSSDLRAVPVRRTGVPPMAKTAKKRQNPNATVIMFDVIYQDGSQTSNRRVPADLRSEERRVGKSGSVRVDIGGRRIIKKKIDMSLKRGSSIYIVRNI